MDNEYRILEIKHLYKDWTVLIRKVYILSLSISEIVLYLTQTVGLTYPIFQSGI